MDYASPRCFRPLKEMHPVLLSLLHRVLWPHVGHFPLAGDSGEEVQMWPETREAGRVQALSVTPQASLRTLPRSLMNGGNRSRKNVKIKELRVGEPNGPHSSHASVCTRSVTWTS